MTDLTALIDAVKGGDVARVKAIVSADRALASARLPLGEETLSPLSLLCLMDRGRAIAHGLFIWRWKE